MFGTDAFNIPIMATVFCLIKKCCCFFNLLHVLIFFRSAGSKLHFTVSKYTWENMFTVAGKKKTCTNQCFDFLFVHKLYTTAQWNIPLTLTSERDSAMA